MRALAALLFVSCTGDIVVSPPKPIVPLEEPRPGPFVPQPAGLRLLTARQYWASLATIFGPSLARRVGAWTTSIAAAQGGLSAGQVEDYETAALDIAAMVFATKPCAAPDDACMKTWFLRAGRLAFRRPLTADELDDYLRISAFAATELNDPWKGPELATAALLQSPSFLYRVELGDNGRFDSYALASRLSFTLWNSPPDDELLDSDLSKPDVLQQQTRRLLADPRARQGLEQLLADWLQLDDVEKLEKDPTLFPTFDAALAKGMSDEIVETVGDQLVVKRHDFRELFDNRETFVTPALAKLYGLEGTSGPVTLPADGPRAGLLGFGGVLALQATPVNTSPTLRGKFVRTTFLCEGIPPPPPGVDTTLPPPMPGLSTRQRLEQHRSVASCAACHALMDPIGFGLENFDAVGAHRTQSNGAVIDASGSIDGTAFTDARGLGRALKNNRKATGCFVRQVYRFALGHIESPGEAAALYDLEQQFAQSGYQLQPLLEALALHQAFREVAP